MSLKTLNRLNCLHAYLPLWMQPYSMEYFTALVDIISFVDNSENTQRFTILCSRATHSALPATGQLRTAAVKHKECVRWLRGDVDTWKLCTKRLWRRAANTGQIFSAKRLHSDFNKTWAHLLTCTLVDSHTVKCLNVCIIRERFVFVFVSVIWRSDRCFEAYWDRLIRSRFRCLRSLQQSLCLSVHLS